MKMFLKRRSARKAMQLIVLGIALIISLSMPAFLLEQVTGFPKIIIFGVVAVVYGVFMLLTDYKEYKAKDGVDKDVS